MGAITLSRKLPLLTRLNQAIQKLFASDEPGVWYDPSDLSDEKLTFRRNLVSYSEGTIAQGGAGATNVTTAATSIAGFDSSIQFGDNSVQRDMFRNFTAIVGQTYTYSFTVKMDDGGAPVFGTDLAMYVAGSPITSEASVTVTAHPTAPGAYIVTRVHVAGNAVAVSGVRKATTNSARTFRVTGFQAELSNVRTAYQKITDYYTEFLAAFPTYSLFQDSLGATQVTAVGQPNGLLLDKRRSLLRGPELVVNGALSSAASWGVGTGVSIAGGVASFVNVGAGLDSLYHLSIVPAGKLYEITYTVSGYVSGSVRPQFGNISAGTYQTANGTYTQLAYNEVGNSNLIFKAGAAGTTLNIDDVSAREVYGNHALQATAVSRPVVQARLNLFTGTEDLTAAAWAKTNVTASVAAVSLPPGALAASNIIETTATGAHGFIEAFSATSGISYRTSITAKSNGRRYFQVLVGYGAVSVVYATFDLLSGTITYTSHPGTASMVSLGDGWWSCIITRTADGTGSTNILCYTVPLGTSGAAASYVGDGVSGVYATQADVRVTSAITRYQRVTTATDYDAVGFPSYLLLDGVDDGLLTGPMTFSTSMDCFFLVFRSASTSAVLAYPAVSAPSNFFAVMQASGSAAHSGSGTPTYAVNGVDVPGGTATTRQQLFDAVPVGRWSVLEARNLDLSAAAWAAFGFGGYAGFRLNGRVGGVVLCLAQSSASRDLIRKTLAQKAGLSL